MNNPLQLLSSSSLTMSSTEISQLTSKAHNDVLYDIRSQLFTGIYGHQFDKGKVLYPKIQGLTVVFDTQTKRTKEIILDRYHTDILVSGYEVKYRAAIVKRWHELESVQAVKLSMPDFTNPAEAAIAWAEQYKAKEAALLVVGNQKASIQHKDDLIRVSNEASVKAGEMLIREFVKSVDIIDLGEKQFYQWMRDQGLIMESREPYQPYVNRGFFTWKPTEVKHGGKYRYTLRVTPRGKVWLSAKYMAYVDSLEFTALGNGEAA